MGHQPPGQARQADALDSRRVEARLQLGLCAWARDDAAAALDAFEEARNAARGNLFVIEFIACIGEAWAHASQRNWNEADIVLMQAEDLRYDVRLSDPETERMRKDLRALAERSRRPDVLERLDKLDLSNTRTGSTHHSRE